MPRESEFPKGQDKKPETEKPGWVSPLPDGYEKWSKGEKPTTEKPSSTEATLQKAEKK